MTYELLIQEIESGTIYDVTTLAGQIEHTTALDGQAGELTVLLQQDPNGILSLSNGSILRFSVDGEGIFYGYIFRLKTDGTDTYEITAYDQMRYLKNEEVYLTENLSASQIFEAICKDASENMKYQVITPTTFIPPEYLHDGTTLYEIIEYGIQHTNVNVPEKHYFIRDNFGVLEFTELGENKTNLIIGDGSLLTSYEYEKSIDDETYNSIKVYRDNEDTGKRDVWLSVDSTTQQRWGKLQMVVQADDGMNEAQIKEIGDNYLKLYNRESETMSLTAIGHPQLRAGMGFRLKIAKLGIDMDMWIENAKHFYEKDYHTMELEVFI